MISRFVISHMTSKFQPDYLFFRRSGPTFKGRWWWRRLTFFLLSQTRDPLLSCLLLSCANFVFLTIFVFLLLELIDFSRFSSSFFLSIPEHSIRRPQAAAAAEHHKKRNIHQPMVRICKSLRNEDHHDVAACQFVALVSSSKQQQSKKFNFQQQQQQQQQQEQQQERVMTATAIKLQRR